MIRVERPYDRFWKRRWVCRCVCGRHRALAQDNLLSGASTGCGCRHRPVKRKRPEPRVRLYRRTFGHWEVIGRVRMPRGGGHRRWRCRCVCGLIREVPQRYLLNGRSTSCGCRRAESMSATKRKKSLVRGLVEDNLALAYWAARRNWWRYKSLGMTLDDAESYALETLTRAAPLYDPSKGKFSTYLIVRIRWRLYDEARRMKTHGGMGIVLEYRDDLVADRDSSDPDE